MDKISPMGCITQREVASCADQQLFAAVGPTNKISSAFDSLSQNKKCELYQIDLFRSFFPLSSSW